MSKPLFKGLALLSSATLVIIFLLYRTGTFDNYLDGEEADWQTSPNGGPFHTSWSDTTIKPRDTIPTIMYSSKSAIIVDDRQKKPKFPDTLFKKKDTVPPTTTTRMMGGSKSVMIIDQQKYKTPKSDTTKKKKKNRQ